MRLLDTIKSWFVKEEPVDITVLFKNACYELGIGDKILNKTNAAALFEEWYTGPKNQEGVTASIKAFSESHTVIEQEMGRFIK